MKKIIDILESRQFSGLEIVLGLLVALLSGIIIGDVLSTKSTRYYGCYNGSNCFDDNVKEDKTDEKFE